MYAKCAWKKYNQNEQLKVFAFNEEYKDFLSNGKTERLCVSQAIKLAEEKGYVNLNNVKTLKVGDKVYATNKGKNVACFIIGKKDIEEGLRVLGAHIDIRHLTSIVIIPTIYVDSSLTHK